MPLHKIRHGIFITLISVFLSGCESLQYYNQAITGHLSVLAKREPIAEKVNSPDTQPKLKSQLKKIMTLREFAEQELQLPVKGQYASYVDLKRHYVVWNVFASPPLSVQAKSWCYPIVGCANYRGYYAKKQARNYAIKLTENGYDTYVGGVAAYSTLGWFKDPVLNTFIHRSDAELANLIFHELAHQILYAKGDTVFNESFATVVAKEGVKRWMSQQNNSAAYQGFIEDQKKQQQFIDLVLVYRNKLHNLYKSSISKHEKLMEKANIIRELTTKHQQMKTSWGGQSDYDGWFKRDINNAQLNTVAAYYDLVPTFENLLSKYEGNLHQFYSYCKELATMTSVKRKKLLDETRRRAYSYSGKIILK